MSVPVRSIRLQKRSSRSLDTLSGASGEIFFDADQNTLRIYTANQSDSIVIADRSWVLENTFDGDYVNLTNKPVIPSDIRDLGDIDSLLFSGDYNDLTNAPDLESLNVDISTIDSIGDVDTTSAAPVNGSVLQWDGVNWVPNLVQGFQDTNTTYSLNVFDVNADGSLYAIQLTGSDFTTVNVPIEAGAGISITENISGNIEISAASSSAPAINDITDVSISGLSSGQVLKWDGINWVNSVDAGGIALDDISVTVESPGIANLSYNNATGAFTYTPPDLSSFGSGISLTDLSVTTSAASSGGSLSYDNSTGTFTFRPANISNLVALTDLSVTVNAAGTANLAYDNATGVFTYTPPDLSSLSADVVNDTTPQLGGNLDLNTNDIVGAGDITITGTVSADSFSSSAVGAPAITSASTITLTAPDGIVLDGPVVEDIANNTGTSGVIDFDVASNNIFGTSSLTGSWTPNFINVAATTNRSQTYTIIDIAAGEAISGVQINGSAATVYYQGGSINNTGVPGSINVWTFQIVSNAGSLPFVLVTTRTYST